MDILILCRIGVGKLWKTPFLDIHLKSLISNIEAYSFKFKTTRVIQITISFFTFADFFIKTHTN